jgi:C-terminal processing protease CtpA/Prc
MRLTLALVAMMLCCGAVGAAGTRLPAKPAIGPLDPVEASNYAQPVNNTIATITTQYVREVSPQDLVRAALTGLYEAARLPVPDTLSAQVAKAVTEQDRLELLMRVRQDLGRIEPLQGTNAFLISVRAMIQTLDPYTAVISADELNRGTVDMANQGAGLELADNPGAGPLLVKTVIPGGPAQHAGLRPGDQITHVEGRATQGMSAAQLLGRLNGTMIGPSGEVIHQKRRTQLTVLRPGSKIPRKVTLESFAFKPEWVFGVTRQADETWDFMLDKRSQIAHIRLGPLQRHVRAGQGDFDSVSRDLLVILANLEAQGMRGLILDLRWCPGGFLNEAIDIADLFLTQGRIASVKYRQTRMDQEYMAKGDKRFTDFPLVVLVNGDTSGGAELIAAALQDNKRAVVVGQRTLGKASVQSLVALEVGNLGMKLTTGSFFRPSGKSLHRFPDSKPSDDWGVQPDPKHDVRVSAELSRQLRDWWTLQTLRPGWSNDALPLDDPTADPQQQAALRVLRERLK